MKFTHFIFLVLTLSLVQCSPKDEEAIPLNPCHESLEGWTITSSTFPNGYARRDLCFPTNEIGYAVGKAGNILKTIDGGDNWELQEFYFSEELGYNENLLTDAFLETVYFINPSIGYAGGRGENLFSDDETDAVLLKTVDGGDTWIKTYLEGIVKIFDLIFFDQENGLGLFKVEDSLSTTDYQLLITHDGGNEWTEIVLPSAQIEGLQFITSPTKTIVLAENEDRLPVLWMTYDQGLNWEIRNLPGEHCGRVYFINDEIGFADCPPKDFPIGIYQTLDGGNSWLEIETPFPGWSLMHFYNTQEGFVINGEYELIQYGWEGHEVLIAYEVFQTFDGGITWSKSVVNTDCDFIGIPFSPSKNKLYILGDNLTKIEKE